MRVLIVDDSITARKVIERSLIALGIKRIYEAKDGNEGLNILTKNPATDIVIVDWEMPVMDGLEFIKNVRCHSEFQRLKIIMASSKHAKEDVITALKAGADNYIAKPFSDQTLSQHLKPVIDSLKPAQSTEEFIRYFSKKTIRDVVIENETMHLDFGEKKISINIPMMIYHGVMQVENQVDGEDDFTLLHEGH